MLLPNQENLVSEVPTNIAIAQVRMSMKPRGTYKMHYSNPSTNMKQIPSFNHYHDVNR